MNKNIAFQKLTVFAFDATTNLPKTGDAANLTAYVSKDDGAVTVLADTSATEMDATNAAGYYTFDLAQAETNADKLMFTCKSSTSNVVVIATPAVVYTRPANASALSIDSNGRVDVIKIAGTTQTARDIGASVLLSSGTGAGQLDFTGGIVKVDLQTIKTQAVTCAAGVTVLASVGTAATSTAQTGDAFARIGVNGAGLTALGDTRLANLDVASSTLATAANLATLAGYVDTEVAAIKAKTDNLPASPAAVGDIPTANQNADALLGRNIDGGSSSGRTVTQALSFLRNKWTVAAGTLTVYGTDDSTTSWTATVSTDAAALPVTGNDPA